MNSSNKLSESSANSIIALIMIIFYTGILSISVYTLHEHPDWRLAGSIKLILFTAWWISLTLAVLGHVGLKEFALISIIIFLSLMIINFIYAVFNYDYALIWVAGGSISVIALIWIIYSYVYPEYY